VTFPPAAFEAFVLDMARVALHWSPEEVRRRDDGQRGALHARTPPAGPAGAGPPPA
jgi:hypothetical protein